MKLIICVSALSSIVLCGCSIPQYPQADGPRNATLIFPDHKNTLSQTIEFNAFTNANCEPGTDDGQLAFFNVLRKQPQPVKLHVDKRIYIRQTYGRAGTGSNYVSCMSMASFVPEAGKSYALAPQYNVKQSDHLVPVLYSVSCEMKIVDAATGILVDTYETLPACFPPKR